MTTHGAPDSHRRLWLWLIGVPLVLLLLVVIVVSFLDEPLRAYAERELNERLPAYTVHIGGLDLHPLSLSLDLEDVIVRQKDHPDPPIAAVSKMHGSLQWSALLSGHLVTDQLIEHPVVNDHEHEIWETFGINSWPTALLIDPEGYAVWGRGGEFKADEVAEVLKGAIPYYKENKLLDDAKHPDGKSRLTSALSRCRRFARGGSLPAFHL